MRVKLMGLFKDEEGQGMVEYGLILAAVAVIAIGAIVFLDIPALLGKIGAKISGLVV